MRVKVRCLRKRGQRISRTEITNSPVVIGEVQTHQTDYQGARYFVANVSDPNNSVAGVLCELFEPVLYNPSLNKMARRGFEANGYVQERLLELVSLNHA